jgi:PHP family Zn ribbon phosphoesterase
MELVDTFGSEITVLLDADMQEIQNVTLPAITDAIQAFRDHRVRIIPGGGGEYGKIELPTEEEPFPAVMAPHDSQTSLFDYQK